MTHNSLYPAFVRIDSESQFGPHSMTVPSVPVIAAVGGGAPYTFDLRGLSVDVNVKDAGEDFVDVLKPFFGPSYNFIGWTLFTMADPDATPVPVQSGSLAVAGTHAGGSWTKAVQATWTWRTDAFGIFKIVLLDGSSEDSFDKATSVTGYPIGDALSDYVTAPSTWVAGRDGGRPDVFLQVAYTLNEKLRRSYRMN